MEAKLIHRKLRTFEDKSHFKAFIQIVNSLVPILLLVVLSFYLYFNFSYYWLLLTTPITSAFMVRLFMIYHDCGHQNFTSNRKFNSILGHFLGFVYLVPFPVWSHFHNKHHANAGNLDERDILDLITLTKKEYKNLNPTLKFCYRFYRSFIGRFLFTNQFVFFVGFRIPSSIFGNKGSRSIIIYNILYILFFWLLSFTVNLWDVFLVLFPIYYLTFGIGSFLFYLQHTFEDAYWERKENWNFNDVAFSGSSFWNVPKIIHWFSGNIGFHHIHHLNLSIPNYNLPAAHNWLKKTNIPIRHISLLESLTLTRYNLWDEENKRMIDF